VAYDHVEFEDTSDFDDYRENLQDRARAFWPSLDYCQRWIGREDCAYLENRFCYFGISEYCGLVAFWVALRGDLGAPQLGEQWVQSIAARFNREFGSLRQVARLSNGEALYQEKGKQSREESQF
jgi:hypothetical protein